jgi:outer membrane protein OmpA-like peptidoglycan-associated protein
MKLRYSRIQRRAMVATVAGLLVSACATTPEKDAEVEAARTQYMAASANPAAQQFAREELAKAEKQLASADAAVESHAKPEDIDHLAYLANQSARTAIAIGEANDAEQRVAEAGKDRERIRLAARTREVDVAKTQAEIASTKAELATQELAALKAKQSTRGLVVTLGDVLFDTDRSELKSGAGRNLDSIADFLRSHPERQVLVEGFTDSVGTDEYNRSLSDRRAAAVREALIGRGIEGSRITSHGYGEQFPVGTNEDAGGRQLNRRVEVIVSNDENPVTPRT